jgi:hypothetical protein
MRFIFILSFLALMTGCLAHTPVVESDNLIDLKIEYVTESHHPKGKTKTSHSINLITPDRESTSFHQSGSHNDIIDIKINAEIIDQNIYLKYDLLLSRLEMIGLGKLARDEMRSEQAASFKNGESKIVSVFKDSDSTTQFIMTATTRTSISND